MEIFVVVAFLGMLFLIPGLIVFMLWRYLRSRLEGHWLRPLIYFCLFLVVSLWYLFINSFAFHKDDIHPVWLTAAAMLVTASTIVQLLLANSAYLLRYRNVVNITLACLPLVWLVLSFLPMFQYPGMGHHYLYNFPDDAMLYIGLPLSINVADTYWHFARRVLPLYLFWLVAVGFVGGLSLVFLFHNADSHWTI